MNELSDRSIALLHYSCPPIIGGAEFILEAQARWFRRYGADVRVIVGKGEMFHEDIPVTEFACLQSDHPRKDLVRDELESGREKEFVRQVEEAKNTLQPALDSSNTWIIHNLFTMPFNLIATRALRELVTEIQIQSYAWTHDIAWLDERYDLPDRRPWNLLKYPADVTAYVGISNHRRNQLNELFGNHVEAEIPVVHDAVEFELLHDLDPSIKRIYQEHKMYRDDIIALYPARIVRRKNFELALQIVHNLKKLGPQIHFIVTGPPDPHNQDSEEYYCSLLQLRNQLDLEEEVIFCHELKHPETEKRLEINFNRVRQLYRISDMLLMTTRGEGFGLPLLEAGLTRTVICCSNVEPLPEIGGKTPLYFELDDPPEAIAGEIHEHLQSQSALKLQRRARKRFTWPAVFETELIPLLRDTFPLD